MSTPTTCTECGHTFEPDETYVHMHHTGEYLCDCCFEDSHSHHTIAPADPEPPTPSDDPDVICRYGTRAGD